MQTPHFKARGKRTRLRRPPPPSTTEGNERVAGGPIVLNDNRAINHDAEEYDERAAKFWSVYVEEAESHDKALIETWKDDMEGIIVFVRLLISSHCLSSVYSLLSGRFIFSQLDCLPC